MLEKMVWLCSIMSSRNQIPLEIKAVIFCAIVLLVCKTLFSLPAFSVFMYLILGIGSILVSCEIWSMKELFPLVSVAFCGVFTLLWPLPNFSTVLCLPIFLCDAAGHPWYGRWLHQLWGYCYELPGLSYYQEATHQGKHLVENMNVQFFHFSGRAKLVILYPMRGRHTIWCLCQHIKVEYQNVKKGNSRTLGLSRQLSGSLTVRKMHFAWIPV